MSRTMERSTTDRLIDLVKAKLAAEGISHTRAIQEGKLPTNVFQSLLRHGKRPILDRAEEICRGLGISMTIGVAATTASRGPRGTVKKRETPPQPGRQSPRAQSEKEEEAVHLGHSRETGGPASPEMHREVHRVEEVGDKNPTGGTRRGERTRRPSSRS